MIFFFQFCLMQEKQLQDEADEERERRTRSESLRRERSYVSFVIFKNMSVMTIF